MQTTLFDDFLQGPEPQPKPRKTGLRKKAMTTIPHDEDERRKESTNELIRVLGSEKLLEGKTYHLLTGGNIDYISQILYLLHVYGTAKRVFISAWSFGSADILTIKRYCQEREILQLDVLTHDVLPIKHPFEHAELVRMHEEGLIGRYINHNIHGKFILFEAETGEKIVVVTSANGTFNPRMEVSTFTVNAQLYDLYDKTTMNIIEFNICKRSALSVGKLDTKTQIPV